MKILLLEDDVDLGPMHQELLEADGHTVSLATNGVDGLKQAINSEFDIIITDNRMPEMDGREFTSLAKRMGVQAPIYACTSDDGDSEVREQFYQAGAKKIYGKWQIKQLIKEAA